MFRRIIGAEHEHHKCLWLRCLLACVLDLLHGVDDSVADCRDSEQRCILALRCAPTSHASLSTPQRADTHERSEIARSVAADEPG